MAQRLPDSKSYHMKTRHDIKPPQRLDTTIIESEILSEYIKRFARDRGRLEILEAGCGRHWPIDLNGLDYSLTGIDIDETALKLREETQGDLSLIVVGDLRTAGFDNSSFDIIYNAFVLEHISGAAQVLNNFTQWLKPGGIIILKIPNRDSVKGFITRLTPFWFHVAYKKYIRGIKTAGEPGFGPYPTPFDEVVSRQGIHSFCRNHDLEVVGEYYNALTEQKDSMRLARRLETGFSTLLQWASFGRLSADYIDMVYIIQKPSH